MPPLEAWEKVFIKLSTGGTVEDIDLHLSLASCTDCHGGDPDEGYDPAVAHVGLIADPSALTTDACADCHAAIATSYADSLHLNLWGERNALAARAGATSFETCPQALQQGWKGECTSCHATCGDCHVSRPDSVGKGFIKVHKFQAKPHQKNQCMACHGSRVEFDFVGNEEEGRKPDVHFTKGMDCMDCHLAGEMHAAAADVPDRYHLPEAPTCEGCHDVATANPYHQTHWDDLSCQVCHSQPYNNCTACHVGGQWKTDPLYAERSPTVDFKIGRNPLPSRRFAFVTLRHAPVAPTSYDPWAGAAGLLSAFDALPTWKYATPHSIRRWTPRTEVPAGASCATNCHLGEPGGSEANADLYLWDAWVQQSFPDEAVANLPVTVDGALPAGWE